MSTQQNQNLGVIIKKNIRSQDSRYGVYNNRTSRSLYILCFHGYSCDIIKVQFQCLDTKQRDRYNDKQCC